MKKGGYGSHTINIYANTYQNSDEIKAHRKIFYQNWHEKIQKKTWP